MHIVMLGDRGDHQLICKCDPQNYPEEINQEKRGVLRLRHALLRQVRQNDRQLAAQFRACSAWFSEGQERAGKLATGWLGRQDSNLGSRDQSPLPYRLATPQ